MFDGTEFLSAYPMVTMSRALEGTPVLKRGKVQGKIRILAIISSPLDLKDHERLQIEKEMMLILQAVDRAVSANRIEIDFEDEASLRNIQSRLEEEKYHIIHYTGHGVYSEREDKAYLLLEDDSGNSRHVDNETIVNLLSGYPSLRLVVLSGCQTAKTSGRRTMSDLSTPLLLRGIPAVVSMQYSISDKSAIDLASKFYTEISNGTAIDQALTKARKELLLNEGVGNVDFATPVLFSHRPDCLITEETYPQPEKTGFTLKKPPDLKTNIEFRLEQLGNQFMGRRREIRRIKEDFLVRGMRVVIIHGIGGIGKTVTASKIVEKLLDSFDGIYAFECSGGLKTEEVLLNLNEFLKRNGIDVLDRICTSEESIDVKINYLGQVLSQIKLLLIFDNFETLLLEDKHKWEIFDSDLKKGLKALVNQCANATKFLFTSRNTFNLTDGRLTNVMDELNLSELSQPEAIMVMNRFPDISKEEFGIKVEIYKKIGGHPYTINIFGRHARRKSAREVLMDIASVNKEMVEFTLLNKSYECLSEDARSLIDRVSIFKKTVPLSGLEWMMRENGQFPSLDHEIDELIHWGLIVKIEEGQGALYQVHTLVKDFIKTKMGDDEGKKWLIKGAGYYENIVKDTGTLWDYLEARELYFDAGEYDKAGKIVIDVAEYLSRWGFLDILKRLCEETIDTTSDSVKGGVLHNLGMIHQDQGDYDKAIEKYNQSMQIKEELGDKGGIAITLGQVGRIYEAKENYKDAIRNYIISYSIFESLNSPNKEIVGNWLREIKDKIGEERFKEYVSKITKESKGT